MAVGGANEPRQPEEAAGGGAARRASPVRSVLYVEDNLVNSVLMEAIVGLRPAVALRCSADGMSALDDALREPPDLFLLDMHLSDMDGIQLLTLLRSYPVLRDIPAIVVSADSVAESAAVARAHGFCDYWTKPLDVQRVLERLDGVLWS